jgi:hypothetical protein
MAVPECTSNEEIPRVANLSELDFHEEYFLKVQYLGNLFITITLLSFYAVSYQTSVFSLIYMTSNT